MTKTEILRKFFLIMTAHWVVFGLVAGFITVHFELRLDFAHFPSNIGFSFLYACVTTFIGLIFGTILVIICWLLLLPPRFNWTVRLVFAVVLFFVVPPAHLAFVGFYLINETLLIATMLGAFILSQSIAKQYLRLVSQLKVKRKPKPIL